MLILAAILGSLAASPEPVEEPKLCRTVHGRLMAANGTPSTRIWVVGTTRMLGVVEGGISAEGTALPAEVAEVWNRADSYFTKSVYGDFRICAWKPQRPGEMQMVRLVGGSNLVLGPYR